MPLCPALVNGVTNPHHTPVDAGAAAVSASGNGAVLASLSHPPQSTGQLLAW
jgi:hypothetical protein